MKPFCLNPLCLLFVLLLDAAVGFCQPADGPITIPAAIFRFQDLDALGGRTASGVDNRPTGSTLNDGAPTRTRESDEGLGRKVTALLFAELAADPMLVLVEREEIDKALEELELSLSGIIDPATANRIGRMTGAKVLISGSVMKLESRYYVIAKVIGTETSRVLGASAKGEIEQGLDPLVTKVAEDISRIVSQRAVELLPKTVEQADRVAAIRSKIGDGAFPSLSIKVPEMHIGQRAVDPAAESQLILIFKELGFNVLDSDSAEGKKADWILSGEGLSEFSVRRKELVAVKARLEVKVVENRSKRILGADLQTNMCIDLTEHIAGKSALQQAALDIAERLIPKLVAEHRKQAK